MSTTANPMARINGYHTKVLIFEQDPKEPRSSIWDILTPMMEADYFNEVMNVSWLAEAGGFDPRGETACAALIADLVRADRARGWF